MDTKWLTESATQAQDFNDGLYVQMLKETQEYAENYGKLKINEAINIHIKSNLIDFNQTIENLQNDDTELQSIVNKLNNEYYYSAVYTVMSKFIFRCVCVCVVYIPFFFFCKLP